MQLIGFDIRELIRMIVAQKGNEFLDSLVPHQIKHEAVKNVQRCPICREYLGRTGVVFVITDRSAVRKFYERFDCPECCQGSIDWIKYVYRSFQTVIDFRTSYELKPADLDARHGKLCLKRLACDPRVQVKSLVEFALEAKNKSAGKE